MYQKQLQLHKHKCETLAPVNIHSSGRQLNCDIYLVIFYFYMESHNLGTVTDIICES